MVAVVLFDKEKYRGRRKQVRKKEWRRRLEEKNIAWK